MKILMCAPRHYRIAYEINPWMKRINGSDPRQALSQWTALRETLESLGVEVLTVPQKKGCPDMVFTANAGVVCGRTFIPSRFRFAERRDEEPAFTAFFRRRGYRIQDSGQDTFFEGEGDFLPYRNLYFAGHGFRSDARAHSRVAKILGKKVIRLLLRQPYFYHLDTCLFPLDDQRVLYFPAAFDAAGRRAITRVVPQPIAVSEADAKTMACNGIRVGRHIVLNKASRALKKILASYGYEVIETPTSEFLKAGGSVKCLLLTL